MQKRKLSAHHIHFSSMLQFLLRGTLKMNFKRLEKISKTCALIYQGRSCRVVCVRVTGVNICVLGFGGSVNYRSHCIPPLRDNTPCHTRPSLRLWGCSDQRVFCKPVVRYQVWQGRELVDTWLLVWNPLCGSTHKWIDVLTMRRVTIHLSQLAGHCMKKIVRRTIQVNTENCQNRSSPKTVLRLISCSCPKSCLMAPIIVSFVFKVSLQSDTVSQHKVGLHIICGHAF